MENPNRKLARFAWVFLFGVAVGMIPMMIKFDQLRREAEFERAESVKIREQLRTAFLEEKEQHASDNRDCEAEARQTSRGDDDGDGARTILVDRNHPYGPPAWNMFGVSIVLPPPGAQVNVSPIWVIPRAVTPHVVDGILGGVYTHIWPNGRTDGWQMPGRAE